MSKVTVWYDGACPLCIREIAFMRQLDKRGRIDFIDAADTNNACPLDRDLMLSRFHAEEDGKMLDGMAAFAAMWRQIPVLRPLGMLARNQGVLWALNRLYSAFLKVRPFIQKRVSHPKS